MVSVLRAAQPFVAEAAAAMRAARHDGQAMSEAQLPCEMRVADAQAFSKWTARLGRLKLRRLSTCAHAPPLPRLWGFSRQWGSSLEGFDDVEHAHQLVTRCICLQTPQCALRLWQRVFNHLLGQREVLLGLQAVAALKSASLPGPPCAQAPTPAHAAPQRDARHAALGACSDMSSDARSLHYACATRIAVCDCTAL